MDGLGDCPTEWSKLEIEKQILYINVYKESRKMYRWTCLQGRNRDTDIEKKHMDTKEGKGSGMNWETGIDIYTVICIK